MTTRAARLLRGLALAAAVVVCSLFAAHAAIGWWCRLPAPELSVPSGQVRRENGLRRFGDSFVRTRGALLEVHLRGAPSAIGYAHARLLYPEMVENEGVLLDSFRTAVKNPVLRAALLDLAQLRYRGVGDAMSAERRQEIAAGALGFQPDPYGGVFPTYQRFVYLNALYDIALSFEHSPLVGCTTFAFSGERAPHGGTLLARAFDFEIEILDRKKAVFFVSETGKIPFASVAWPGLVGVVSGMNREGVAVVVHGGRAGPTKTVGEPVVHALRRVLSTATTTDEALRALAERAPLVSHILVVADSAGRAVRVERVPGAKDHVAPLGAARAVTNHFVGPSAPDEKNLRVMRDTSSIARKRRADELVDGANPRVSARDAIGFLRDRRGADGKALPLGDRRAIDAMIAAHGVVMDTAERALWVSEAPHLIGRFLRFELTPLLDPSHDPARSPQPEVVAADELLTTGAYDRYTATAKPTEFGKPNAPR